MRNVLGINLQDKSKSHHGDCVYSPVFCPGILVRVESKIVWVLILEGTTSVPWVRTEGRPWLIFLFHLHLSYNLGLSLRFRSWSYVSVGCRVLWVFYHWQCLHTCSTQFSSDFSRSSSPAATFNVKFIFKAPIRMPRSSYKRAPNTLRCVDLLRFLIF